MIFEGVGGGGGVGPHGKKTKCKKKAGKLPAVLFHID